MKLSTYTLLLLTLCWQSTLTYAQKTTSIRSPDKAVVLAVSNARDGQVTYRITYKGKKVIEPSSLGFTLSKPQVSLTRFTITAVDSATIDETWKPVWGETSQIRTYCKELRVTLADQSGSGIRMQVRFRLFNDGVGFRYEFPQQPSLNHFVVADELTQFALAGDHKTFWIPGDYDSNEYLYNTTKLSEVAALAAIKKEKDIALQSVIGDNAIQTPLLFKTADGLYISLYEAAVLNYPIMHLLTRRR